MHEKAFTDSFKATWPIKKVNEKNLTHAFQQSPSDSHSASYWDWPTVQMWVIMQDLEFSFYSSSVTPFVRVHHCDQLVISIKWILIKSNSDNYKSCSDTESFVRHTDDDYHSTEEPFQNRLRLLRLHSVWTKHTAYNLNLSYLYKIFSKSINFLEDQHCLHQYFYIWTVVAFVSALLSLSLCL